MITNFIDNINSCKLNNYVYFCAEIGGFLIQLFAGALNMQDRDYAPENIIT